MKNKLICMGILLLLFLALPLSALAGDNLVTNGDFSQLDESGLPVGWSYSAWYEDELISTYWTEEDPEHGTVLRVESYAENDARVEQEISVRGNSLYHIYAKMKAEGGDPSLIGGNISVSDTLAVSGDWTDTDGEWVTVELYGKTGIFQNSIIVALRVGFYGQENLGTAWFDDVVVEKVDAVPDGYEVQSLKKAQVSAASDDEEQEGADWISTQTFLAGAFIVLLLAALYRLRGTEPEKKTLRRVQTIVLVLSVCLRLVLAAVNSGYEVDINCFTAWGQTVAQVGTADFYGTGFCDYPPGYLYVLGLQGLIAELLQLTEGSAGYLILLKLPSILCDAAICEVLFRMGSRCTKPKWAALASACWAFMPAVLMDGVLWGQIDSVLALFILLVLDAFLQKNTNLAAVLYGIAVMIKPQALMLGTVMLCGYALEIRENPKKGLARLGIGVGLCALTMVAIALPFLIRQPITYIFELFASTLSSYPYATVNALNLYYLLDANWVAQDTVFLGLSYASWGTIGLVLSVIAGLTFFFFSREKRAIPLTSALILIGAFCLGSRMHERYMYPALLLLLAAALLYEDRRVWWTFAGFSLTNAVNIYIVLQNGHVLEENRNFGIFIAALNLLLLFYLVEVCFDLCVKKKTESVEPEHSEPLRRQVLGARLPDAEQGGDRASFRMSRKDYLLMMLLTVVYACTAFYQLGDTTATQTLWDGKEGDSAILDLGSVQEIAEFRYYGEIPYGDFEISFSSDGTSWSGSVEQSVGVHDMFKWHTVDVEESARYIRLIVTNNEIKLFEVAAFDAEGNRLEIASSTAENLTDEQEIVPDQVSYMNGMYFDEVYHGRTAYEQLHNMEWYENTHPPLGKVFISWSIALFGMTPFGWRFAGTLAGVLMVPAMYLLCKLLFRKTPFAFMGTLLMTFDFMHLAQTRLGTIDSYPVLFIILGFYFMLRYAYHSFYHEKFRKTLPSLFFSGLFMGLGMASKWIGVYAAAGLAVLFFTIFWQRTKEYLTARKTLKGGEVLTAEKRERCEHIALLYPKCALWTILWCVLFFVVIPVAIYIGSYYQFLRIDSPHHGLQEVWNYQIHMFNYHKGVFETHPFQSSWWQWPLDLRNIWYYVSDSMPEGWVSSISALGSPAVWWTGFACMVWCVIRLIRGYAQKDRRILWVVIGFAANYLPWVLVPRVTFVYHYFASVPFIILASMLFFENLYSEKKWGKPVMIAFMVLVVALYALFYPVLTGIPMTELHASLLKWLPSWTLY